MTLFAEQPVVLQGQLPSPMLGILTLPDGPQHPIETGVIIVNGGAQYRAGAHRLFVVLARELAGQGHAVLRFDLPGQGDSPGDSLGFEETSQHIRTAIDTLLQWVPTIRRPALLGLCDGASASLLYVDNGRDPRIKHLVLINPWVHNELNEAQAQVKHYYRQRLLMPDFWKKLLRGKLAWSALAEFTRKLAILSKRNATTVSDAFPARMARAWRTFPGHISLVLSDHDQVAQEFLAQMDGDTEGGPWSEQPRRFVSRLQTDHTLSVQAADIYCISQQTGACLREGSTRSKAA